MRAQWMERAMGRERIASCGLPTFSTTASRDRVMTFQPQRTGIPASLGRTITGMSFLPRRLQVEGPVKEESVTRRTTFVAAQSKPAPSSVP